MSTPEAADTEQWKESTRQDWSRSVDTLRKWNSEQAAMSCAATEMIVQAAHIGLAMHVLDVASGTGDPALTLAEVIGPSGHVTATDLVPEMLAVAEECARERGLANISFKQGDAEALPFPDRTFDVVTCRHGVMFFPNVVQALREAHRVLKPGGRAAFTAQGSVEQSTYQSSIQRVLRQYVQLTPPEPGASNPFRFAQAGTLSTALGEAGFREMREESPTIPWPWPGSPEQYWEHRRETAPQIRHFAERLAPEQREKVIHEVIEAIRQYWDGQQVNFTAVIVVASGVR